MAERTRQGTARAKAAPASTRSTRAPGQRRLRLVPTPRRRSPAESRRIARRDLALLCGSAGALTVVGLVMVLSAGSVSAAQGYGGNSFWYFQRQVLYAAVGVGAAIVVTRLPPRIWRHLGIWVLGGATVLMVIAAQPTSGTSLYGASRWIDLGPVTIQPSEFAKLGLVAVAATILTNKWSKLDEPMQLLMPLAPIVLVVALLGIAQRDLGTTLILCGLVFVMLFVAGVRMRYLAHRPATGLLGAAVLIFGETYRRTRFFDRLAQPVGRPARQRLPADPGADRDRVGRVVRHGARHEPCEVGLPAERALRLHLRGDRGGARAARCARRCSWRSAC